MNDALFKDPVDDLTRFQVGATEFNPEPSSREIKHMLYLVAYDIAAPKRLRLVAQACEDYGVRVEKSVFECDLPPEQFEKLWCRLIDVVDEEDDALIAYRICASCLKQAESMGAVARPDKPVCYVL